MLLSNKTRYGSPVGGRLPPANSPTNTDIYLIIGNDHLPKSLKHSYAYTVRAIGAPAPSEAK